MQQELICAFLYYKIILIFVSFLGKILLYLISYLFENSYHILYLIFFNLISLMLQIKYYLQIQIEFRKNSLQFQVFISFFMNTFLHLFFRVVQFEHFIVSFNIIQKEGHSKYTLIFEFIPLELTLKLKEFEKQSVICKFCYTVMQQRVDKRGIYIDFNFVCTNIITTRDYTVLLSRPGSHHCI